MDEDLEDIQWMLDNGYDYEARNSALNLMSAEISTKMKDIGWWDILRSFGGIALTCLLVGCAPMPKEVGQGDVPLEDCRNGNPRCTLCVSIKTGEGDWYSDIPSCPKGSYRVVLPKKEATLW